MPRLPAASTTGDRRWVEPGGRRGAPQKESGRRGLPSARARYRGFKLPLRQPPAPLPSLAGGDNRHRCLQSLPTPQRQHGRAVLGGWGEGWWGGLTELRVPAARPGPPRGRYSGAGGAPPVPAPPPPPRSPGGLQPCFSVSEAEGGGDGVLWAPPGV